MSVSHPTEFRNEQEQAIVPVFEFSSIELEDGDLKLLPPSKREISNKKRNGVFYTPDLAAQLLVKWGVRCAEDTILEPSFGGCGFLEALVNRLKSLGSKRPECQLFGCDIEPEAFVFLTNLFGENYNTDHFKQSDFLTVHKTDFKAIGVDVVIGNPPYVSWHNMLPKQRESASAIKTPSGSLLNFKGSLWTFFVAHSLRFLNRGGRMAWILPGSFMHADYAKALRDMVSAQFTRSLAVMLKQRLFIEEGTEESSVILLCEGYQQNIAQPMYFSSVEDLIELQRTIEAWEANEVVGIEWPSQASRLVVTDTAIQCFDRLLNSPSITYLGSHLKITIGLVTGDNKYFVLNSSTIQNKGFPREAFRNIVARQAHFRGLQVTFDDLTTLEANDVRCLLLNTNRYSKDDIPKPLKEYLSSYPIDRINSNQTFAKRRPWYQISQQEIPDGFFSCMNWHGPSLALNAAQTTCTNTVYKVQFNEDLFADPHLKYLLSVCLQSTFSQFSAEIVGRVYGSGALKLEPSEALRIALLLPHEKTDVYPVFIEIDNYLRIGQLDEARQSADNFMIQHGLIRKDSIDTLEEGLLALRALRQKARKPPKQ